MNVVLVILGVFLILAVFQDIFFTVLFPASQHGIIRKPILNGIWKIFQVLGRMTSGQKRRNLLAYSGPTVIISTLLIWFLLLILGWAMIYKPALGLAIRASSGQTDTSWATAIYYSGYAFTTLGTGDVIPKTGLYRILTTIEAATGFAVISLVITYFQSVYSSLIKRNAFAQGLHYFSRDTDDAAEIIVGLAEAPDLPNARQHLSAMANALRQIYQAQRFYPVLRYFHYQESFYSLPRILLTTLDLVTLLRTTLDEEHYHYIIHSAALDELTETGMALLDELINDSRPRSLSSNKTQMWQDHYEKVVARLADVGLQVNPDRDQGAEAYVKLRARWDQRLRDLAKNMLYEWCAIE